ncbi:MAG TPA: hypothetical protein VMI31_01170 [Fimbriimonadaceae bacterium]|nr:hypothetical protein [Fimbriimonadaceae bacterium]
MNKLIGIAALFGLAAASIATLLPKGADVRLAFDDGLTSRTARVGDKVKFHVVDDVVVDGQVVIKKGEPAEGTIVDVARGRRFGVNARLRIRVDPIAASDGTLVPVASRDRGKATGNGTDQAAAASGAGMLVLGPIGLGVGYFVTGKDVTIEPGDTLSTVVSTNTEVKTSVVPASGDDAAKSAGRS